ncbi:FAD-dependent oxidoreductase [Thermaerobacter litoralis]
MSRRKRLVVVGGVAAGMSAASRARRLDPDLEIEVFERSGFVSYGSCGLPYFVGGLIREPSELVIYTPQFFRQKRDIAVHVQHEVTAIHPDEHYLEVRDLVTGRQRQVEFDTLILATGARPVEPPIPGLDLKGVHFLRLIEDGIAVREHARALVAQGRRKAVVVGGGYIGLEMAEALVSVGMEVAIVERLPQVMPNLDPEMAELVHDELRRHGVALYLGEGARAVLGDGGRVRALDTDARTLPADLVLVAVGVRPNSELAKAAGIELGAGRAIKVDEFMRTSHPAVYAAGDCADTVHRVSGRRAYIPLGTTANKQGRVAGENAAGGHARFPGVLGTAIVKVFDLGVARTGLTAREAVLAGLEAAATTIRHGSRAHYYPGADKLHVRLVHGPDGRLLGAQMAGPVDAVLRIDTLVAALHAGMTVDQLYELDLAYAPPFAPVWDPVLIAARQAMNAIRGVSD